VILDVVYNHWGPEGLDASLGRLDGWWPDEKRGIYFYPDRRSETPYGSDNRPDFGRGEVRQFIRDNAMTLLDELRADGLRLDSTIALRRAKGKDHADTETCPTAGPCSAGSARRSAAISRRRSSSPRTCRTTTT
jgi:1,4-alpha-glucan branching enzyme